MTTINQGASSGELLALAEPCEKAMAGGVQETTALLGAADGLARCGLITDAEYSTFLRLLNAGAYLDAAMTLVPEGWEVALYWGVKGSRPEAQLETAAMRAAAIVAYLPVSAIAATPALALVSAALKARAAQGDAPCR